MKVVDKLTEDDEDRVDASIARVLGAGTGGGPDTGPPQTLDGSDDRNLTGALLNALAPASCIAQMMRNYQENGHE